MNKLPLTEWKPVRGAILLDFHSVSLLSVIAAFFSGYIRHKSFGILLFIFRFIIKGKRLLHNLTEGIKNVNVYFLLVCAK